MSQQRPQLDVSGRPLDMLTEDEAFERAKALSLITQQEDEKRRQQLYGPLGAISSDGSKPQQTSLIARPRPQARSVTPDSQTSIKLPPQPRSVTPDSQTSIILPPQPRSVTPESQTSTPLPPTSPRSIHAHPQIPPRPMTHPHVTNPGILKPCMPPQLVAHSPKIDDEPLISFSPSSKCDPFEFDLRSLDPLHTKLSPKPASAKANEPNYSAIPKPINPPRVSPTPAIPDLFATLPKTLQHQQSSNETQTPPVNNRTSQPAITRSAPASPKKQLTVAVPLPPLPLVCPPPDLTRSLTPTPSQTSNPFTRLANDPLFLPSNQGFHKVPSDPNVSSSFQTNFGAEDTYHSGSIPNVLQPPQHELKVSLVTSSEALTASDQLFDGEKDLMGFPKEMSAEKLLSLESFDPFYVPDTCMSDPEKLDSTGLFTNPYNKYERKNTPNPFPDINAVSSQKIMKRLSPEKTVCRHYNKLDLDSLEDDAVKEEKQAVPEKEVNCIICKCFCFVYNNMNIHDLFKQPSIHMFRRNVFSLLIFG